MSAGEAESTRLIPDGVVTALTSAAQDFRYTADGNDQAAYDRRPGSRGADAGGAAGYERSAARNRLVAQGLTTMARIAALARTDTEFEAYLTGALAASGVGPVEVIVRHWPAPGLSTTTLCQRTPLVGASFAARTASVTCPGCLVILATGPEY